MATLPHTTDDVTFDAALRGLADQARTRYAGEEKRLAKALVIALNHGVTFLPDGTALVQSQSDAEIVYEVRHGQCDCKDASRAPEGRCKHRWATCLVRKAQKQRAAEAAAHTYYATLYRNDTDDTGVQGTAQSLPQRGWMFRNLDDSWVVASADHAHLVLGGREGIASAKRQEEEAAGGLAAIVCGYGT